MVDPRLTSSSAPSTPDQKPVSARFNAIANPDSVETRSTSQPRFDVKKDYLDKAPLPKFIEGVNRYKSKTADRIQQYVEQHPEDRDLLKPAPLSDWMKGVGKGIAKTSLRIAKFAGEGFDKVMENSSPLNPVFNNRILKTPDVSDTVDYIAAKVGLPLKDASDIKKEKQGLLSTLHDAFVVPVKDGFEIARMPAGKKKEEAFDAWAYKTAQSFTSGMTIGVTDEAQKNNAVWLENGELMWRGVPISDLSELENKGVSAGNLTGQFLGSMVVYGMASPMLTAELRTVPALNTLYTQHPYVSSAILTNLAEEGMEAVVRKSTGQEYTFTDTLVGMMSGIAFETGKLAMGKFSVDGDVRPDTEVDIGKVREFLESEAKAYTLEHGHPPDPNAFRARIGEMEIPGTKMTIEQLHQELASSGIKEARLIELKGGQEGRPGIDFPAEPPKPDDGGEFRTAPVDMGKSNKPDIETQIENFRKSGAGVQDVVVPTDKVKMMGEVLSEGVELKPGDKTPPPVGVYNAKTGEVELIDGARRYSAFQGNYDGIPMRVIDPGNDLALPSSRANAGFTELGDTPARFAPDSVDDVPLSELTPGQRFEANRVKTDQGKPVRKFSESIQKSEAASTEVKQGVAASPDRFYEPITNEGTMQTARKIIADNEAEAVSRVNDLKSEATAETYAIGQELIRKFSEEGRHKEAVQVAETMMKRSTTTAQALQSLAMMSRMDKDGALVYAARQLDDWQAKKNIPEAKRRSMTDTEAKRITDIAEKIERMPDGEEKMIETARMMSAVEEMTPPSFAERASALQTISMLLNFKTAARNIVGNIGQIPAEFAQKFIAAPADVAVSKLTGKRTIALPSAQGSKEGFYASINGMLQGIREAYEGVNTRAISGRYFAEGAGSQRQRYFRGVPGLEQAENTLSAVLRAPDRAFYEGAYTRSIENQMRARGLDFKSAQENNWKGVPQDILEEAQLDANRAIFEESSRLRTASVGFKRVLNLGLPFGVGDVMWKFAGIPANLLKRGLEYSPVGYVKFITEAVKGVRGLEFSQKQMVESFGRATAGSLGSMGIGMKLAELGIITGSPNADRDIEAIERRLGMGRYKVNMSALKRYALSFDPAQAKKQEGDSIMSYDWFQPFAMNMSLGANIYFNRKKAAEDKALGAMATALGSIEGSLQSIEGLSMVQGLRSFLYGDDSWTKRFADAAKDLPASFVPTIFSQMRQYTDNISRETYDPNPFKEAFITKPLNKFPILSEMFEPRFSSTDGQPLELYQDDSNTMFNVFFNPAFMTKVVEDKQLQEVLAIYNSTGEKTQAPRVAPRSVQIDGVTQKLNAKQIGEYQKFLAENTRILFDMAMHSDGYAALPDELRAQELTKIINGVNGAAKIYLFGANPEKQSQMSKEIVEFHKYRMENTRNPGPQEPKPRTNSVILP